MKPFFLRVLLALLALAPFYSIAQTDTTYYDRDWNKTEWIAAKYYRLTTKINDHDYKVEDHYFNNNKLQMSGRYSSLDSEIKNGVFVYYNEKGHEEFEEQYENDKKTGTWKAYYDSANILESITNYINDKKNGLFIGYNKNGGKESEGQYENDEKTGIWKGYYENDTLWHIETYDKGKRNNALTSYYKNGKIKRKEIDNDYRATSGKCWDELGNEIKFTPFEVMPEFKGDIGNYLSNNIRYPKEASIGNIQGRVLIKFVVNEDGTISDVTVAKSVAEILDMEAMRIVRKMPKWKPGIQDDKAVKVYFTLPIMFKLK